MERETSIYLQMSEPDRKNAGFTKVSIPGQMNETVAEHYDRPQFDEDLYIVTQYFK